MAIAMTIDIQHTSPELHKIKVLEDGRLEHRADCESLSFKFKYCGFDFVGQLNINTDNPILELNGIAGIMPFSVQLGSHRQEIAEIILRSKKIPGVRFVYHMNNRIHVQCLYPVLKPVTSIHMLAATTQAILSIEPYLRTMSGYLIADAVKASGQ
jgi:hypothetical protein